MITLGITGPTGCGKTTLLQAVKECGGTIVDCDVLYGRLLETDAEMKNALTAAFPEAFTHGALDRKRLAQTVFRDEAAMKTLNDIAFYYVGRASRRLQASAREEGCALFAVDAINLLESDLHELCDVTVGVLAPIPTRAERIMQRDGLSYDEAMLRINAQKPEEFYRQNCHIILENNADMEQFEKQAAALCRKLLKGELG